MNTNTYCYVCKRTHAEDPHESCEVGEAIQRSNTTLTRTEAWDEAHATPSLPTGSHAPSFTDRCNVVRAESYKRQQARNARFEHLRRLLCKPEAPVGTATLQQDVPMVRKELAQMQQRGAVVSELDTPDCAYVKTEGLEQVQRHRDPAAGEWDARRVWGERVSDADLKELRELDGAARVQAQGKVSPSVLIVLNRPKRRVTLKHTGTHDGSKYYGTAQQAEAKARELRQWFGQHNRPARIWVAA